MSGVADALVTEANLIILVLDNVSKDIKTRLDSLPCEVLYQDYLDELSISKVSMLRYKIMRLILLCLGPGFSFGGGVYRFNEINNFIGHQQKKRMPKDRRNKETKAGNFVSPVFGFPFSKSKVLFKLAKRIYWSNLLITPKVSALFQTLNVDGVFIGQVQTPKMHSLILEANRRDLPSIGYIASWDQPSTKGPIPELFSRFVVQSHWMQEQLIQYHELPPKKISVVGWPQMDIYHNTAHALDTDKIKKHYNIPTNAKVLLFALNAVRLGKDEPNLVKKLTTWISTQDQEIHLVLRPHPKDKTAQSRYNFLHSEPHIHFADHSLGTLDTLLEQIDYADVILNSTGSFSLDATALDKPFIYIGFEGEDDVSGIENISNWYSLDHLASVVETNAVGPAYSFKELTQMIDSAFHDPESNKQNRATLREKHIEPFDGKSADRLAELILSETVSA